MDEQFVDGYAILIGVNENSITRLALPDVVKDVTALTHVLIHPERCAYPEQNIKTIIGTNATRQGILDGLEWLEKQIRTNVSDNTTVLVYYSGHGWRDDSTAPPEYYLIPYDTKENRIKSSALRATDFAEAIEHLKPHRLLVILDCCHAGGMGVKNIAPPEIGYIEAAISPLLFVQENGSAVASGEKGIDVLKQGSGRAVLTSSRGEQRSYMRKDGAMSVFTYHLIESLTGHAQPATGATEVLVSDVMSHVWRCVPQTVRSECGQTQEPDYQVSGNFPIALLIGGKGLGAEQSPPSPLTELPDADHLKKANQVQHIEGGIHIYDSGSIHAEGDVFGRDKNVYGNKLPGRRRK